MSPLFKAKITNKVTPPLNEFKFTLAYIRLFFAFSVVLGHYEIINFLYNRVFHYMPYFKSHFVNLGAGGRDRLKFRVSLI